MDNGPEKVSGVTVDRTVGTLKSFALLAPWKPSACVASTAFTKLGVSQALMDVRSTTS